MEEAQVKYPGVRCCTQCGRLWIEDYIAGIPFRGMWKSGNELLCDPCMQQLMEEGKDEHGR